MMSITFVAPRVSIAMKIELFNKIKGIIFLKKVIYRIETIKFRKLYLKIG